MKILYPGDDATVEQIEEVLKYAIEGRKRVKDQLMRIDDTYAETKFYYEDKEGRKHQVTTLEESEYPKYYHQSLAVEAAEDSEGVELPEVSSSEKKPLQAAESEAKEGHTEIKENQKGVSYDMLFSDYIKGAEKITITDPYIRIFYQIRNLMEFIEMVIKHKAIEDEVQIHLITIKDDRDPMLQLENFEQIRDVVQNAGVIFTWEFDTDNTIHARHIITDTGWKISLDRGLDIFQHYEMNNSLDLANRLQEFRSCKAFEVTYIKVNS
jgi:ATP-dependent Lon protease